MIIQLWRMLGILLSRTEDLAGRLINGVTIFEYMIILHEPSYSTIVFQGNGNLRIAFFAERNGYDKKTPAVLIRKSMGTGNRRGGYIILDNAMPSVAVERRMRPDECTELSCQITYSMVDYYDARNIREGVYVRSQ